MCADVPLCRPVCTLADLDAYLALQHKVGSYNDLRMGPQLAHELVVANFRPPEHLVEVPKVGLIPAQHSMLCAVCCVLHLQLAAVLGAARSCLLGDHGGGGSCVCREAVHVSSSTMLS